MKILIEYNETGIECRVKDYYDIKGNYHPRPRAIVNTDHKVKSEMKEALISIISHNLVIPAKRKRK